MNYNNTYIRTLCSPGFSSLMMSWFKTNLALGFTPYLGKDNIGRSQYDKEKFLSTTIDYEKASALYLTAKSILEGEESQVQITLSCGNYASLIFKYEPDQNNQMTAYLILEKNGAGIPFRFVTHQYQVKENGQVVTKILQTGLGAFATVLNGYLCAVGADLHLNKLSEEELGAPQMYQ